MDGILLFVTYFRLIATHSRHIARKGRTHARTYARTHADPPGKSHHVNQSIHRPIHQLLVLLVAAATAGWLRRGRHTLFGGVNPDVSFERLAPHVAPDFQGKPPILPRDGVVLFRACTKSIHAYIPARSE